LGAGWLRRPGRGVHGPAALHGRDDSGPTVAVGAAVADRNVHWRTLRPGQRERHGPEGTCVTGVGVGVRRCVAGRAPRNADRQLPDQRPARPGAVGGQLAF
jgi:hypothetical protein